MEKWKNGGKKNKKKKKTETNRAVKSSKHSGRNGCADVRYEE